MRFGPLAHLAGSQDRPPAASAITRAATCTRLPEQIAGGLGDLAEVDADVDLDSAVRVGAVVVVQCALDSHGGTDRCIGGREGDENPSPRDLCTRPPKAMTLSCTISACDPKMSSGFGSPRSPQRGRADDVGHHDREHLGCGAAIRQGLPPC